jgi:hypothetical protein
MQTSCQKILRQNKVERCMLSRRSTLQHLLSTIVYCYDFENRFQDNYSGTGQESLDVSVAA